MKKDTSQKFWIRIKWLYHETKYYASGLYNKLDEDHVWIMSSSIAFNILICVIPIILIFTSILGIYLTKEGTQAYLNETLDKVIGITPELKQRLITVITSSVSEMRKNSFITGVIGTIGILWAASGLFSTIRDVLNRIYKTRSEIFYLWVKLRDIGMVFLITVTFFVSFSSTFIISVIKALDDSVFGGSILSLGFTTTIISHLIGLLFSFLMFYLIFKLVPEGKVSNTLAVISGATAAVLYEALKSLFLLYLISFADYQKVYGAYATIVAVIFWIYYSSFTFVIGAEVGQLYKEKKLIKQSP